MSRFGVRGGAEALPRSALVSDLGEFVALEGGGGSGRGGGSGGGGGGGQAGGAAGGARAGRARAAGGEGEAAANALGGADVGGGRSPRQTRQLNTTRALTRSRSLGGTFVSHSKIAVIASAAKQSRALGVNTPLWRACSPFGRLGGGGNDKCFPAASLWTICAIAGKEARGPFPTSAAGGRPSREESGVPRQHRLPPRRAPAPPLHRQHRRALTRVR